MLNFTDQMDDVRTLAHEIGHAMQFQLAGERQTALTLSAAPATSRRPISPPSIDRIGEPSGGASPSIANPTQRVAMLMAEIERETRSVI